MKKRRFIIPILFFGSGLFWGWKSMNKENCSKDVHYRLKCCKSTSVNTSSITPFPQAQACVFKTVFNEEPSRGYRTYKTPAKVQKAIKEGEEWILQAQQKNGGWGAGSHYKQNIRDPHAVKTDPATTSMVCMALLRGGTTLDKGPYKKVLERATIYLFKEVEQSKNSPNVTTETNTQIQRKLGQNIDVVITAQYFSNLLEKTKKGHRLYPRIQKNLDRCVEKIQGNITKDGKTKGAGWAGVLQSSMASAALEAAESNGAKVDKEKLEASRNYQSGNYNADSDAVDVSDGAGIMLYSVSGSVRGSAKKARKVREAMKRAKKSGKVAKDEEVTVENLQKIGYSPAQAQELTTSYRVYESAKNKAQDKVVMNGFGNNGGEEFISFLQTGESLIINKDDSWSKWYDDISGKLLSIQNKDGSWNGHHCITSPVYCTATCLMILSIQNDIEELSTLGAK